MDTDGDFCSTSSTGESTKHLAAGQCDDKLYGLGVQQDHKGTLNSIWYKATELCQSNRLKTFLRKQGKLSSLCVNHGISCTVFVMFSYSLFIHLQSFLCNSIVSSL